ncbi:4-phosphoerythronate dehydrogenase PdxB [Alkalimarinus sediminis]|uniref:Erythronate-4-phosphate dehydrogenase n=1 Tax=Alkalimarinus sediminis TaxID=1632866 RepID=A0A9E8HLB2_9ALTE|nr:4-phosphoerythronate dehydrogenase PdxB [Alkalimarinus sediminis]UZW76420.1 4-phosphoerythronate dehydrogenase PdxB [Alkalimarinus sediminis]
MKIVADENIPLLHNFFGDVGEIDTYPGRQLTSENVKSADILLVRSVTQVNEALLAGSRVKFVGTCTIGTDHIDTDYLQKNGITFSSAPGCNANSVVEYVISTLSVLSEFRYIDFSDLSVGVVGCGNVGSRVVSTLRRLGAKVLAYDPLIDQTDMASFEDVLKSDVISLHTPLTTDGPYPTYHLFNESVLAQLSEQQILINSGRGAVVDGSALKRKLKSEPGFTAVLDVWETEPNIDPELARLVAIGTPHIAGYSLDGKIGGTEMIYQALCRHLGLPARHKAAQFIASPPLSKMYFTSEAELSWSMHTAIRAIYDVRHDHYALRRTLGGNEEQRVEAFDRLRKEYRARREFSNIKVLLKNTDSSMHTMFKALGFNVKSA